MLSLILRCEESPAGLILSNDKFVYVLIYFFYYYMRENNGPWTVVPGTDLWIGVLHEALAAHGDFTSQLGRRIGDRVLGNSRK